MHLLTHNNHYQYTDKSYNIQNLFVIPESKVECMLAQWMREP